MIPPLPPYPAPGRAAPRRRGPRLGGGTLLFLVLMALVILAISVLFQSFGDSVMRGQRQVREASYMRYLGDAALTEATIDILKRINSGVAGSVKLEDLFGTTIEVPLTKELSQAVIGHQATRLDVTIFKDNDRTGCDEALWGEPPHSEWSKYAFPCEDAGLMVLVANIEVEDPLGGQMAGRLSRAFGYRKVSPAPPKGLNTVTFMAFDWKYFRDRVTMASNELFDVLLGGAYTRVFGEVLLRERFAALEGTVAYSRGIAALSRALLKTAGFEGGTGTDATQLADKLLAAIQEECVPNCREGIPIAQTDDPKIIRDCVLLSEELWASKRNTIVAMLDVANYPEVKVRTPVEWDNEDPPNPTRYEERIVTDPTERFNAMLGTLNPLLAELGGKPLAATDLDGARAELLGSTGSPGRLSRTLEDPGSDQNDGLWIGRCHRPPNPPNDVTRPHSVNPDKLIERVVKLFASSAGAWKQNVRNIFERTLKGTVLQQQRKASSAGVNMTLENILLFAAIRQQEDIDPEKTAALSELGGLDIKFEDTGRISKLAYPGMAPMDPPVKAIEERVKQTQDEFERTRTAAAATAFFQEISQMAQAKGALSSAYLADVRSQEILQGPLYLTEQVDSNRLQYTFSASPHRLNITELFPLPSVLYADPNRMDTNQRGFMLPHANWGRSLGGASPDGSGASTGGGGGPAWTPSPKGYKESENEAKGSASDLFEAFRTTPDMAMHLARAYGAQDRWKDGFESQAARDILLNQGVGSTGGPPNVDLEKLDGGSDGEPFSNPMAGTSLKDSEALRAYKDKWNEVIQEFTQTLEATNNVHLQQPFKAWPRELPDQAPAETQGWEGTAPVEIPSYSIATPGDVQNLQESAAQISGAESKGKLYIRAVLDPKVNRQRSAFRFADIAEFEDFLTASCGRVMGTYFISGSGTETVWDVEQTRARIKSRCGAQAPADGEPMLQGFAYISFPNRLKLTGNLGARGTSDTPGSLVLVAQGVQMSGSNPTIRGTVLSNGEFFADENAQASIEGTLVTTGTQTKGNQQLPSTTEKIPYEERNEKLGQKIGELASITITPNDDVRSAPPREDFMRVIFSPFRVAESFEMRRR